MGLLSFGPTGYGDEMFFGALITIQLAVAGYLLAFLLGTLIAVCTLRPSGIRWALWRGYASIFMGVPSLLVIFLFYFGGSAMISAAFSPLGLDPRVEVSPMAAGIVGLGLVYSAYVAEFVRAAIWNVPPGQFEACRVLLVPARSMWLEVIFPQVMAIALPGIVNLWIIVLKDTAIVSLVGLNDIIGQARIAAGSTKEPFVFYTAAAVFFVSLSLLTIRCSALLERRARRGIAPAT
jgi:His/Glu/Gln/Arg/opine family amino acid ABC transporter permease subunit